MPSPLDSVDYSLKFVRFEDQIATFFSNGSTYSHDETYVTAVEGLYVIVSISYIGYYVVVVLLKSLHHQLLVLSGGIADNFKLL